MVVNREDIERAIAVLQEFCGAVGELSVKKGLLADYDRRLARFTTAKLSQDRDELRRVVHDLEELTSSSEYLALRAEMISRLRLLLDMLGQSPYGSDKAPRGRSLPTGITRKGGYVIFHHGVRIEGQELRNLARHLKVQPVLQADASGVSISVPREVAKWILRNHVEAGAEGLSFEEK